MILNSQGETRNPVFVQKEVCSGFPGKMGSHLHLTDDGRGEVSILPDKDHEWINPLGPGGYLGR